MAEVNQDLVQQLEQNIASFERAGLTEDAEAAKAKLAEVQGGQTETAETAEPSGYADMTKEELYAEIQKRGIEGMSAANKDALVATLEADDRGEVPTEGEG